MNEPLVCAIMLVNGREAMVRRAVESFRAQSYENKRLMIYDSGWPMFTESLLEGEAYCHESPTGQSVGALRNRAIRASPDRAEIFCHFDSDDWSHPERIAEQVALLQSSGADLVGYYEVPFWDTRWRMKPSGESIELRGVAVPYQKSQPSNEAWLYRDPARRQAIGASFCYWRKTWERRPFDDINHGEDQRFAQRCKVTVVSALPDFLGHRLICGIHGDNTSHGYDFAKPQQCFKRAPQFDAICAARMKL